MTATGAEAGSDPVPAAPAFPVVVADTVSTVSNADTVRTPETESSGLTQRVRSRTLLIRSSVGAVLALLTAAAGWLLLQHGIRTDYFPPFLEATESTPITRYSGPWLTAAAAAALVAALLLMFAARDLIRWSRAKQADAG